MAFEFFFSKVWGLKTFCLGFEQPFQVKLFRVWPTFCFRVCAYGQEHVLLRSSGLGLCQARSIVWVWGLPTCPFRVCGLPATISFHGFGSAIQHVSLGCQAFRISFKVWGRAVNISFQVGVGWPTSPFRVWCVQAHFRLRRLRFGGCQHFCLGFGVLKVWGLRQTY